MMKLAYLAEVRYLAATGARLTTLDWRSWKYGPDSRELYNSASNLGREFVKITTQKVRGHTATYFAPTSGTRPTLDPDIDQLFDDLFAVYGGEDTTRIISAAYRSTPFRKTRAGRRIELGAWGASLAAGHLRTALRARIEAGLKSPRTEFRTPRELVEFLSAARGSNGGETR